MDAGGLGPVEIHWYVRVLHESSITANLWYIVLGNLRKS
jgi:hypothetical protein